MDTWFGNDAIWIRLPQRGIIPSSPEPGKSTIYAKFPWWRVLPGQLTAWARPLHGGGRRLLADVRTVSEYGPIGFVPSALRFSGPGCWLITGSLSGHTLSFVAKVVIDSH